MVGQRGGQAQGSEVGADTRRQVTRQVDRVYDKGGYVSAGGVCLPHGTGLSLWSLTHPPGMVSASARTSSMSEGAPSITADSRGWCCFRVVCPRRLNG